MTSPYDDPPAGSGRSLVSDDTVLPPNRPGRAESRRSSSAGGSPLGKVLLVLGVAIVCALAIIGGLVTLGRAGDPVAQPQPTPTTSPGGPSASATPTAASASPTSAPPSTPAASASPTSAPTRSASPSAKPTTNAAAFETDRSVPVTVLNGTSTTGLAAKAAADLRAKGWTVVSVGNWGGGGVDGTTVFVVGNRDAAATMRRDLPAADLTTRPIGLMKRDRITVVVMGDYRP